MAFFDFIKKPKENASALQTPVGANDPAAQTSSTTQVVETTKTTQQAVPQTYNGIESPAPSHTVTQQTTTVKNPPSPVQSQPAATHSTTPQVKTQEEKKREEIDLMTHLTQRSNRVFLSAQNKAKELKADMVDSEHLLHGLLADSEIYNLFIEFKIHPQLIEEELQKIYKKGANAKIPQLSPRIKRILGTSLVVARKLRYEFISPEHILLALVDEGEGAGAKILSKLGLKKQELNKKIIGKKEGLDPEGKDKEAKKNIVDQYTIDLTAASQGLLDAVVERSPVIERVIHILSRRTKNNPALVGEAGVGKTAIVEGLAQKIVTKNVPEPLLNKRILQLDLMSIIAGASHRGEFEERMKELIEQVQASKGQIILFIDEIHNIVGAGSSGENAMDVSNFLKPALARGELQLIGATTLTEYRKYIEKDPALERRFQPILVPEPSIEQAIKMVKAIKDKYEAFHRVKIPDDAIEAAVKLSKRYVGDRFLPDKAVDLIDEAASAVRLPLISLPEEIKSLDTRVSELNQEVQEAEKKGDRVKVRILRSKVADIESGLKEKRDEFAMKKAQTTSAISPDIIKDIVSRWTGIPISKISDSELGKLTQLEKIMHERLIGQNIAVTAVSGAVRRGRAGLKSTQRPIGSFVFLGPTGVGKTELAKTLAEVLFGQEEAMIRFDMTEYMERHEVAKLLGAPPGYVGYEEGGKLTEVVRRKPYSVVLFDEVEKAHPDIFNILLQILDDGRLTDNKGHVISFKNTVVICTSNIGTKMIQDEMIKSDKAEIEEPPYLSSYTFSPSGREILTIGSKYFQRSSADLTDNLIEDKKEIKEQNPSTISWEDGVLLDYFAGQEIEKPASAEATEGKPPVIEAAPGKERTDFPIQGFTTHAISPKGEEVITKGGQIFIRPTTTAKSWKTNSLIEYFKEGVVVNAIPDAPDEQLPTAKLKTHAFSPDEKEIVSYKDRYWLRKAGLNDWQTGHLKDYFAGSEFESSFAKASPSDKSSGDKSEDKEEKIKRDNNIQTTSAKPEKKESESVTKTFPTAYWDIHTFSPIGKEIIVVGETVWFRNSAKSKWNTLSLHDYFGKDFPLEKELEEKRKVDEEIDKKKYDLIKDRVTGELRKFFRPELLNRFDEVIIFEPLKFVHMMKIVRLQLKSLGKLLEDQDMGLIYTEAAVKEIVREGFDPIFGARPLRRAIQKLIENPISTLIIEKKVSAGNQIQIDFDGEAFIFNIESVEMMSAEEAKKNPMKNFLCEACGNHFMTLVKENSTAICSKCASTKVQQVIEPPKIEPFETKKPISQAKEDPVENDKTDQQDNNLSSNGKSQEDPPSFSAAHA